MSRADHELLSRFDAETGDVVLDKRGRRYVVVGKEVLMGSRGITMFVMVVKHQPFWFLTLVTTLQDRKFEMFQGGPSHD